MRGLATTRPIFRGSGEGSGARKGVGATTSGGLSPAPSQGAQRAAVTTRRAGGPAGSAPAAAVMGAAGPSLISTRTTPGARVTPVDVGQTRPGLAVARGVAGLGTAGRTRRRGAEARAFCGGRGLKGPTPSGGPGGGSATPAAFGRPAGRGARGKAVGATITGRAARGEGQAMQEPARCQRVSLDAPTGGLAAARAERGPTRRGSMEGSAPTVMREGGATTMLTIGGPAYHAAAGATGSPAGAGTGTQPPFRGAPTPILASPRGGTGVAGVGPSLEGLTVSATTEGGGGAGPPGGRAAGAATPQATATAISRAARVTGGGTTGRGELVATWSVLGAFALRPSASGAFVRSRSRRTPIGGGRL